MSKLGDLNRQVAALFQRIATETDMLDHAPPVDPPPIIPPVDPPPIVPPIDPPPAGTKVMHMDWNNPQRLYSSSIGGFGPNDVIAVHFRTGPIGTNQSLPRFAVAEYQDPPATRYAAISNTAGNFDVAARNLYSGPSNSVTVTFAIAPGSNAFYGALQPNTDYFMNIRNENGGGNVFIDLIKAGV